MSHEKQAKEVAEKTEKIAPVYPRIKESKTKPQFCIFCGQRMVEHISLRQARYCAYCGEELPYF